MAVDYSRFIVPEGDFSRLDKLGETLATQAANKAAAKAKADKERKLYELDAKDLLTNTLADEFLINGIQDVNKTAYDLFSLGIDYNQAKMMLSNNVTKLYQNSQAAKNLSTQLKANIESNKNVKGIDQDKYARELAKAAFLNPDGKSVKDTFDPTLNYDDLVRKTGDIYKPDEAIAEDIKNMPKNSEVYSVKKRDSKGNVTETKERIETATGFEPYLDKDGIFQGVIPQHTEAPLTETSKSVNDYITKTKDSKEPLNLITDDHYERLRTSDPVIMGAVNKDTRDFAVAMNRELTPEEITTFQKAKIFDLYLRSGKGGFKHETVEAQLSPVTKINVNTGGGKSGPTTVRDISGGIEDAYKEYVRPNKPYLQMNLLKEDEQLIVLDAVRNKGEMYKNVPQDRVYIRKDESTGDFYAYVLNKGENPMRGEGKPLVKLGESLNIKATPGTKGKSEAVSVTNKAAIESPKMSSFSNSEQKAIKAFMKANGLTEKEGINEYINYKKK